MADEALDKQAPEGSDVPPLKIKVLFSRFPKRATSETSTVSLSSGLQPVAPPPPVKVERRRGVKDYKYLVPPSVHLGKPSPKCPLGNTEQRHPAAAPSSVGPCPPHVSINTNRPPPVSCFGPKYTYRNAPSAMEQLCRHPHLQPVPNLQLVHMQPPGQRQTGQIVQPGRAVPVPSAPSVKKPEHQRIVKFKLSTQPGTQEAHQPHLLQPEGQKTTDFKDEFQLPQVLLNTEQFPDIEKPIASTEPLLSQCFFPPINSKEATQDSSFQKMSLERATGKKEVKNIRRATQGRNTREMQTSREAYECPVWTSLLPVTRKTRSTSGSEKANANLDGAKRKKKEAKIEAQTVEQIPWSHLASLMKESVHVFNPLGKNHLSVVPSQNITSVTSHTISEKTATMLPRPLPQPLPKPLPSTWSRQQPKMLPTMLLKLPSNSVPQSGSLPKPTSMYEWFTKSKPSH